MDILKVEDKIQYIKKMKSKLNDEDWSTSRFEMYLILSLYHKCVQRSFPASTDVDYFEDSLLTETLNTIPLEWINELQINEDIMTLMHHLPINTTSHILKIWAYFIYGEHDRCSFNIDNVIQVKTLIENKVEKEKKVNISVYYPKLIYLRGACEEIKLNSNEAVAQYLLIFKLTHLDYDHFLFGKGCQDVLYRLILLSLKKWYLLKPTNFTLETLGSVTMDIPYDQWQFQHCNTILWNALKLYFKHIINNTLYISAQHILILKYTITLIVDLNIVNKQPFLSVIFNQDTPKEILDDLFTIYYKTISTLVPFPLAPARLLYKINADPNDLNMNYSTVILANKRIHDFCNLYMYRVLNTDTPKDQFISILKQCLSISFHSLKLLRYIAVAYCSLGEYEQAVNYINTYTQLAKERKTPSTLDGDDTLDDYTSVLVLASRLLLIEMDHKLDESISMAKKAIELMQSDGILKSRALQLMGMAMMQQSNDCIPSLLKALELDPTNWLISYQISLGYFGSNLQNALIYARQAIKLNKYHVPSWHILALLLSSLKDYSAALQVCKIGFSTSVNYYFPKHSKSESSRNMMDFMSDKLYAQVQKDSVEDVDQVAAQLINLKLTETMIVQVMEGPKQALRTCKEVLKYYKGWNQPDIEHEDAKSTSSLGELPQLTKSNSKSSLHSNVSASSIIPKPTFTHISDTDVMKNKKLKFAFETAISRARTVSRRAKNLNLKKKKEKPKTSTTNMSTLSKTKQSQRQQHVLITIWSRIVKLLIASHQIEDARESVVELQAIDPLNVDVWIGEGLVLLAEEKFEEAIDILENISMENQPIELLMALASGYFQLKQYNMAEHVLYTIMNHSASQFTSEPWYLVLIKVYDGRNSRNKR